MKVTRSTKYRVKMQDGQSLMRTGYELEFEMIEDVLHVRVMRGSDLVATLEAHMSMVEVMTMMRDLNNSRG